MSAILNAKSSRLKFARRMRVANTSAHREFQFLPLLLTFPPFFPSQHGTLGNATRGANCLHLSSSLGIRSTTDYHAMTDVDIADLH